MSNTTFIGSDPVWANACVGENGFINYVTYAEGFSKAANLILDRVLSNYGNDIDSFIYPICFNMRHSIELRLKGAIEEIQKLANIKGVTLSSFSLAGSHDIGNIWVYFKQNSEMLDVRFKAINNLLDKTILDIAEIDSTGQTFRYPVDVDNNTHLTEQCIISCKVLKEKFHNLEENLNNLNYLNYLLIDEYKKKTFTKKFSRAQIFNLVQELPEVSSWTKELKSEIRSKYSLSSNDLSKILDFVKTNYEISKFVGIKKNLMALPDELVIELSDIWVNQFYPKFRELYSGGVSSSFYDPLDKKRLQETKQYIDNKQKIYEYLEGKLTLDFVADLWALYYISRDSIKYSEDYIFNYEYFKKDIAAEKSIIHAFNHIFSKTDFVEAIIYSLFFLQKTDIAEIIIKNNDLGFYFKKIPEARSRQMFNKWDFLDYHI